nr:ras GTPase-activating protein 4B isoform X5 [Macaca fascicularis]
MAKRSSLYIRIVEGKNLPAKDITGSSDPYCIVKVDNEPIIRTATVWKTLCPFWGEEYQVHLPPTFHTVAFYVMDEDALSRDDVIGKVCLPRDTLASHPKGFSGWTHLTEVDPDEEVQGEIHLRLEVQPGTRACRLRCSVLEARDLAPKDRNGASDPFVRVRYKGRTQETSIVKKSCYPRWNETFEFELEEGATEVLCVETWDWDLVSRNDFLGKVVIDIQRLQVAQPEEGWFRLQPYQTKSRQHDEGNLGSLQLEVRLRDEMVLPSSCYQPLVQLLCHEVKLGMQGPGQLISLIEETTSTECRQDVATNLLKLFLGQGLAKDFLDLLFQLELSRTSETNTLFRSNSLASKSMESFLKVAGMQYLHGVLGPIINKVFEEKKYVELDPSKVEVKDVGCSGLHRPQTEAEVLEQSAQTLRAHLGALLSALSRSVRACPAVVRATFRQLFRRVRERFPGAQHEVRPPPAGLDWDGLDWAELDWAGAAGEERMYRSSPSPASCACASSLPPSCLPSSSTCGSATRTPAPAAPCSCWPRCGPCGHGRDAQLGVPPGPWPGLQCVPTGSGEATGTPTWALHFTVCKAFLWPPCSSTISWIGEQACEGSEVAKAAQPVGGESWDLPTRVYLLSGCTYLPGTGVGYPVQQRLLNLQRKVQVVSVIKKHQTP